MEDVLFQSIQNIRKIIDNSIKILKDADSLLYNKDYVPLLGNLLATETSKNILQSIDSKATMIPQFIGRPYVLKSQLDEGTVDHMLQLNIQLSHPEHKNLIPVIAAAKIKFENPTDSIRSEFKSWHLKYAVFENGLHLETDQNKIQSCQPFKDCNDTYYFTLKSLSTIQTNADIAELANIMLQIDLNSD